jgi:hypothetical protein
MIRISLSTALFVIGSAATVQAQQAPLPPKTVNPTPATTSGCRGCSDAGGVKTTPMKGYDDRTVDTTKRKPVRVVATTPKPKPRIKAKAKTARRSASKAERKPAHRPKSATVAKKTLKPMNKPAILDPLIMPKTSVAPADAKRDTLKR